MWAFLQVVQKSLRDNKQPADGRKNRQTDLEQQMQESEVGTLAFYVRMFMAFMRTQQKSYTTTKYADSSLHCRHCSVSSFLTARPHHLTSECLILHFKVPLPTDQPSTLESHSLTRSHKRTSMGPSRSCWNGTSALQPEEITSKWTRVPCVYYQ